MIDLHSKILFNGDPNSTNLKETLQIAKAASKAGFRKLLATPVFVFQEEFTSTYEYDLRRCEYINNFLKENEVDIEIYLGNEINDSPEIIELLKTSQVSTINNTQYILLKFHEKDCDFYSVIDSAFKLQVAGYMPIISQMEIYDFSYDNHHNLKDLIRRDILIQLDVQSITGLYGEKIKKTAKDLLKNNMVHVLGTNAENPEQYVKSGKALSKIHKIVGDNIFKEITTTNSDCILNNEVIYPTVHKNKKPYFRINNK